MSLREAAQAILDWLDAEEIWHPKQLSDDLRIALFEDALEKLTAIDLELGLDYMAPEERKPLRDAALLAPESGQLKDRGTK